MVEPPNPYQAPTTELSDTTSAAPRPRGLYGLIFMLRLLPMALCVVVGMGGVVGFFGVLAGSIQGMRMYGVSPLLATWAIAALLLCTLIAASSLAAARCWMRGCWKTAIALTFVPFLLGWMIEALFSIR